MKKQLLNEMHTLQRTGVSPILVALSVLGKHNLSEMAQLDIVDAYLEEVAE